MSKNTKTTKKKSGNSFILQGSILAVAAIVAKVIGLIYRVPLTNILGDSGNSYYSTANEIYSMILMVSSFSLPLAVSKMMAERIGRGEYRNANKVFMCALRFAVVAGGLASLLTYLLSGFITKYIMNFELAKYGLRVIAPAILIFAITGTFRGFFQGFGNMVPTAVSQVIEQIVNAVLSVVCAGIMFRYGVNLAAKGGDELLGPAWGAAGGTFGTVGSVTIAMIFMMIVYTINRRSFARSIENDNTMRRESERTIYRALILTILPIVASVLVYNMTTVVDQGIFNAVLKSQGFSEKQYSVIWGIYVGKFRVLMNVVLSLASSLGPAIVPSMTASMSRKDYKDASAKVALAIRFTMIFSIPCAFGLAALGGPIVEMLFHPDSGIPLTAGIMQAGALMIILYALSTLTTAILQGMGKFREPLIHCCIAMAAHIIMAYVLLRSFKLYIYAVIYANIFFALLICILNARTISKALRYRQEVYKTFFVPTAASAIMAFAVYGVYHLLHLFMGVSLPVLISIVFGAAIYAVGIVAFKGITASELLEVPKGRYILRIFRKLGLMR